MSCERLPLKEYRLSEIVLQYIQNKCNAINELDPKIRKNSCGREKLNKKENPYKGKKQIKPICVWSEVAKKRIEKRERNLEDEEEFAYPPYGAKLFSYLQAKFGDEYDVSYNNDRTMIFVGDKSVTATFKKKKKSKFVKTTYPIHVNIICQYSSFYI